MEGVWQGGNIRRGGREQRGYGREGISGEGVKSGGGIAGREYQEERG